MVRPATSQPFMSIEDPHPGGKLFFCFWVLGEGGGVGFGGVEAVWVWEGCPLVQPDHLWVCVFKARIFTTTGNSPSLLSRQEKKGKNLYSSEKVAF